MDSVNLIHRNIVDVSNERVQEKIEVLATRVPCIEEVVSSDTVDIVNTGSNSFQDFCGYF